MASIDAFCNWMYYWCAEGNLGYDQSNRWDIRTGGETDCSALVIFCARSAGFDTGSATYTGNMSREFTARGWRRLPVGIELKRGDILLADWYHVAVYLGDGMLAQASIDERGEIRGGQSGDQIDYETNVRSYYDYPWDCILRYAGGETRTVEPSTHGEHNPNGYDHEYVRTVQSLLVKQGFNLEIDGVLGPITFKAIKDYQAKRGLLVDGIPGPETLGTLKSDDQVPPASRSNARREVILEVDGVWSYQTTLRAQVVAGTYQDKIVSDQWREHQQYVPGAGKGWEWGEGDEGSSLIGAIQSALNTHRGAGLDVDYLYGPKTIYAHQAALGVDTDHYCGYETVMAFQAKLNAGRLF